MSNVLGLAASAAGGGIFGLLGTAGSRLAGFFEQRQAFTQERARWAHEVVLHQLNIQAKQAETEAEIALAQTAGSWKGLEASMLAEASLSGGYRWVDAVRALTRPTLTLLLWVITAGIFLATTPSGQADLVDAITFAATAATLWWFGDRSRASSGKHTMSPEDTR